MPKDVGYHAPVAIAIALDATTPVPNLGAGAMVWSTTANQLLRWDGTAWRATETFPQVAALPTLVAADRGNVYLVQGTAGSVPDKAFFIRYRTDGSTLVATRIAGRALRLKLSSADYTPTTVAADVGGTVMVPYDPDDEASLTSIVWTVVDIIFRLETTASSGTTSLKIQRSTGTGAFVNAGYLNTTSLDILAAAYEPAAGQKPAPLAVTTVNSGDKLRPEYTALGTGASGFSVYVVLRES